MSYKVFALFTLLGAFSCIPHRYDRKLPNFNYNGVSHNKFIEDRIPQYGDGERDGCLIMDEIDLSLKSSSNMNFEGQLKNAENQEILNNAEILIYTSSTSNPLILKSNIQGKFDFKTKDEIEKIEVKHLELRTLTLIMKRKKSLLKPK